MTGTSSGGAIPRRSTISARMRKGEVPSKKRDETVASGTREGTDRVSPGARSKTVDSESAESGGQRVSRTAWGIEAVFVRVTFGVQGGRPGLFDRNATGTNAV
jgi:hypothetical protein